MAITHVASDSEYLLKLKEKLTEEVKEYLGSGQEEELADILEVIYALSTPAKLEMLRKKKAEEKGAFKDKIILDETNRSSS